MTGTDSPVDGGTDTPGDGVLDCTPTTQPIAAPTATPTPMDDGGIIGLERHD